MKKCGNFTLIELLVVIGIIVLLAGLILPAVMSAQQKGRITQAKADMASILTALKSVENTYNRMVNPDRDFGGASADEAKGSTSTDKVIKLGGGGGTKYDPAYQNFIVELSDPTNSKVFAKAQGDNPAKNLNINLRRIKFLDPKTKYQPGETVDTYAKELWLDPWGNQYVILINTSFTDKIPYPSNPEEEDEATGKKKKYLSAKAVVYSLGPNGVDNDALNVLTSSSDKTHDDVTSWD